MKSVAITNIGSLVTNDESLGKGKLGEIQNAALVIEDGKVSWVGKQSELSATDEVLSVDGRAVIPGFVDSHSHLLFAGDRSEEFSMRMQGQKYSAGGIQSTVEATRQATDKQLEENLLRLVSEMHASGITTFETKSGYGLNTEDETRSLKIAAKHTRETTFLGAHVVPKEYAGRTDSYVELVKTQMLENAKEHAKWIDVFCDAGAFDSDQAKEILLAGKQAGLLPRIHANQISSQGAIEVAVQLDCASADHCTHLTEKEIDLLASSRTVATLLPGAEFSTRSKYPDAKRLLDAGVTVALATDCNPGSSYTTSMPFCIALAVREMGMHPDDALMAATLGGAKALRRNDIGSLDLGNSADLVVLNAPNHLHLSYRPGVNLIEKTIINGKIVHEGTK
jgi:imidazolonepropionase